MNQESYIKISNKIRSYKRGERVVKLSNEIITKFIYGCFVLTLGYLCFSKSEDLIRVVLTTAIPFVLVSIFRYIFDSKRPYTIYDFEPIIKKEKAGQSMPSRHVFSAFVIGMAYLYLNICLGIIFLTLSVFMAIIRVISGVHFPKDVIVGAVIGILSGIIGFYLI